MLLILNIHTHTPEHSAHSHLLSPVSAAADSRLPSHVNHMRSVPSALLTGNDKHMWWWTKVTDLVTDQQQHSHRQLLLATTLPLSFSFSFLLVRHQLSIHFFCLPPLPALRRGCLSVRQLLLPLPGCCWPLTFSVCAAASVAEVSSVQFSLHLSLCTRGRTAVVQCAGAPQSLLHRIIIIAHFVSLILNFLAPHFYPTFADRLADILFFFFVIIFGISPTTCACHYGQNSFLLFYKQKKQCTTQVRSALIDRHSSNSPGVLCTCLLHLVLFLLFLFTWCSIYIGALYTTCQQQLKAEGEVQLLFFFV